ncbi:ribosomal protein S18 acetylase RimI-like enzyme [Spirosoma oryzae]|uniref:Ribosomal protein S18 acetylase RimI-like enzyme n=1 Tax=Spirosoma oryzae TaxID=1469603 RepID=A0A2T0T318_9BACT|nr:GNAT family N-acetyltransferase [Spirosoma oryzae]PRY40070.1 ribosomal protein S18 acetylase RimI-like enzyme [Spirosoma oryzae]
MEYVIRKIREGELSQLIELCRRHAEFEQAEYTSTNKESALRAAIFTSGQKLFCYVIEVNSCLVGYFTYTFDFSTWDAEKFLHVDCVYLDPPFRGLRIGEHIFNELRIVADQTSCVNIQWQTPVFNDRAIKFYKRIGAIGKDKVRFFIDL